MRTLAEFIFFALAVVLFNPTGGESADLQKGQNAYNQGDYATALHELQPLAEQGNAAAQYALGVMHANGDGIPMNFDTALKWYTLAAEQGYAFAQYTLAKIYGSHDGVPTDYVRAHMWANIAANNGFEVGGQLRDEFAKEMTPVQIEEAQKLYRECVKANYIWC